MEGSLLGSSLDQTLKGALREMPTRIVTGQGTGAAAALAVKQNIRVRRLDIRLH